MRPNVLRTTLTCLLAVTVSFTVGLRQASAQDLPTDAQLQAAFGVAYNHLGLMQYCAAKKLATSTDVANSRKILNATVAGMDVSPAARVATRGRAARNHRRQAADRIDGCAQSGAS